MLYVANVASVSIIRMVIWTRPGPVQ